MGGEVHDHGVLRPDTATDPTRPVPAEGPVRVVPKPDCRQHRAVTPRCPRCLWSDGVTVRERSRAALLWCCSRCDWSWSRPLRQTKRAARSGIQHGRPSVCHWTCPDCERYTVRLANATNRVVTYYGCGAVEMSGRSDEQRDHRRGCWDPERPDSPRFVGPAPASPDSSQARGESP